MRYVYICFYMCYYIFVYNALFLKINITTAHINYLKWVFFNFNSIKCLCIVFVIF